MAVSIVYGVLLQVNITMKQPGRRLEHNGIRIEFIGQIGKMSLEFPLFLICLKTVMMLLVLF